MTQLEVFAPGRTELAGNHVDHQGGMVITGTTKAGMHAHVEGRGDLLLSIESQGFPTIKLDLADAAAHPGPRLQEQQTSAALVRGMADQLISAGYKPRGANVYLRSEIPSGGGLSSSAAYEMLMGCALKGIFEAPTSGALDAPLELAAAGMRAEREYFGKPCGCMDQAAIALGGINVIDFADAKNPTATHIDFDFAGAGYAVVLVDTAVTHDDAGSQADYASIPLDMQKAAYAFGAEGLGQVEEAEFLRQADLLQRQLGEMAVSRARHYFDEIRLTRKRAEALKVGDMETFVEATRLSGASSRDQLKNLGPALPVFQQVEKCLGPKGACRIHGGGFGGYIQAFMPAQDVEPFVAKLDYECTVLELGVAGAGVI